MDESIRLGRIRGIAIGVNWSVLVIAWLLVWGLADGVLPDAAPGYHDAEYWGTAAVATVFFFAGLLAHELAHSLVARRFGVTVDRITLWLFGGVSQLHGEAPDANAELRIAAIGPVLSLAVAAGFGVLALLVDSTGGPALAGAALEWLALINAVLAVFNLVPAAPLDGGRVLHAIVWRRSGDRGRATAVATGAGRAFAYVLIGAGVVLLAAGAIGGLWFAFLGWFLLMAARAEATHELLHGALAGVSVRDVMTSDPAVVPGDTTVETLVDDWFLRRHCSSFPVEDASGSLIGIVTLRRVRREPEATRSTTSAADVATRLAEVATSSSDEPLTTLLERMARAPGGDGRALVLDDGRLVGIVTPTDIQRALDLAALRTRPPAGSVTR
jgi:Zn-dependent protease/CBS domain-containing protein